LISIDSLTFCRVGPCAKAVPAITSAASAAAILVVSLISRFLTLLLAGATGAAPPS
jgi:hypothetical protein